MTGFVQRLLHRTGVHLARYPLRSEYENVLHDFLAGFGVGCVLDVGANVGRFGLALRRLGYGGRIASFEPVAATFERLRARAAGDPRWEAHRMALGLVDGEAEIRTFPGHENATLARLGDFAREWLPSALKDEGSERVPVRRLDTLLADGTVELDAPAFLKVDAEGFDWQVIEGAGSRVEGFVGLQMEMMVQPMWPDALPFGASVTRLAEMGFEPVAFSVANRARFSAIVVDGLFRNARFAPDPARAAEMWNPAGMGLSPQVWTHPADAEPSSRDSAGASWTA
ncbi:FkbM family methyltransferase [Longimicrobium sp.]|uniref:FkbM family methyltransferase n=1 Tax=Longimicrobium sp. TaxID=2029185 RepID=UPI002D003ACB|nr:FkbM family methyltransferase [Longimicrobium sp.]HSU14378.1 FkbM family methyltransferase [Longimicrobium sp.]